MSLPSPDETLLGLLAAHASHGYDLLEAFRQPSELGRVWSMGSSQVYAVLKRLERDGLIVGEQTPGEVYAPRTEYTLTEAGHHRLRTWLDEPYPSPSVRRVRVEFLSRLYIAQRLNYDPAPIIDRQRAACARDLERLARDIPTSPVEGLALALHREQLTAVMEWLDLCQTTFQTNPHP
ncbi:MAG: PadR family transcriptional regulator [Anaerolineae bacterium]|nr:PadR family transcriptional regulator [Anaerolineae bacterium]